jgi:hypothetical protein
VLFGVDEATMKSEELNYLAPQQALREGNYVLRLVLRILEKILRSTPARSDQTGK